MEGKVIDHVPERSSSSDKMAIWSVSQRRVRLKWMSGKRGQCSAESDMA